MKTCWRVDFPTCWRTFAIGLLLVCALVRGVAAEEVGSVTAASGSAEIRRGGVWRAAVEGEAVHLGDSLRTGGDGRLQVLLRDDSVITLAEQSLIAVDEQTYDPSGGAMHTLLRMIGGKVRSLVSDAYELRGGQYEIETATAVAGVRGTEFIVAHDPTLVITQVIGVSGKVAVNNILDRARRGVFVTAGEVTRVRPGEPPSRPAPFDPTYQRQLLEGFDFIGTGPALQPGLAHPIVSGAVVPDPDRAPESVGATDRQGSHDQRDSSSTLVEQPPNVVEAVGGDLNVRF